MNSFEYNSWVEPNYGAIAVRIEGGDRAAESELINGLTRGIFLVAAHMLADPSEAKDVVNDVFSNAIKQIRAGALRDPDRLPAYIHGILKHVVGQKRKQRMCARNLTVPLDSPAGTSVADSAPSPEQLVEQTERRAFVSRVLAKLSERDREVLRRYYLLEQPREQICVELELTETQFRLIKTRAKTKFGEAGKRALKKPPVALAARASSGFDMSRSA